jgi:hypothetical protein
VKDAKAAGVHKDAHGDRAELTTGNWIVLSAVVIGLGLAVVFGIAAVSGMRANGITDHVEKVPVG